MQAVLRTILYGLLLPAASGFAQNADLSGRWQVHNEISGTRTDQSCMFQVAGSALSGDCTSENSVVHLSGTINGREVSWTYETRRNLIKLSVLHKGNAESGKISGIAVVSPFGAKGTFTATRQK